MNMNSRLDLNTTYLLICLVQLTILRLTPYSKANNGGLHCVNTNTHQSNQVAFNIRSSISWPIIFTILILIKMEKNLVPYPRPRENFH